MPGGQNIHVNTSNYDALGVSASKKGLHKVLEATGAVSSPGLFASVLEDIAGDPDYYSVVHCDGAGTKTIVPYLMFRETGSYSFFAGLAQDALVMNLDDIYCLGLPQKLLLANAVARNARLIDDKVLETIITSYKQLCEMLTAQGIPITMSGGETADCGDVIRTLMIDATLVGRIKKSNVVDTRHIVHGDVIVGVASTGKASYETVENSGIGSNGLTLARHALLSREHARQYPEILDPSLDTALAYRGPYAVTDTPAALQTSVGAALASPTRTYAPLLQRVYALLGSAIHGVIHVTGGGMTKVLRFGEGNHYIKDQLFEVPPLFSLIQDAGKIPWREMYQVFNMGHRLELYVPENCAQSIIDAAAELALQAKVIGRVIAPVKSQGAENTVSVVSPHGTFEYTAHD